MKSEKLIENVTRDMVENKNGVMQGDIEKFLTLVNQHEELKQELINKIVDGVENSCLIQDLKFDNQILTNAKKNEIAIIYKRVKTTISHYTQKEKNQETNENYDKMKTDELLREILKKLDKIIK